MTSLFGFLLSLVLVELLSGHAHAIVIEVYRNGDRVMTYRDDNAEYQDRAYLPDTIFRGQMHYAVPRNACQPVARTNETDYSWVALIDNYYDCPDNVSLNLYEGGYGMMIAYSSSSDPVLYSPVLLPSAIVISSSFVNFLKKNTIIGISTNASEYYVKVTPTSWLMYEKVFMIFGGVLLAAVALSVLIFCGSIFFRFLVVRWRTRGLSRWRVRQLPKRRYRKGREVCESCSICLEEFKAGENVRVLPCDHIFHPSCVDEWLRKWNRTCPLCKSTIQRRRKGGQTAHPQTSSSSSTTNHEQSHLLNHEEREESQGPTGERREADTYGALGHFDNPLTDEWEEEEERRESSAILSSTQTSDDRRRQSNLVRNGDTDEARVTTLTNTSRLEETA